MSTIDMDKEICESIASGKGGVRQPREQVTAWCNSRKELEYLMQPGDEAAENILRDKKSGWKYNYYQQEQTMYDVPVAHARASVNSLKRQIKEYDASLEGITQRIENSKRNPDDPKFKMLKPKDVEELEAEYIEIYKRKCDRMVALDGEESVLEKEKYAQMIDQKRLSLLHHLRNTFMVDGDEKYMRAGTAWVEQYIADMRK
jgi:hypothetical protein